MLVPYSVRSMFWLRGFAVASTLAVVPYFLAQPDVVWPPIFSAAVFTTINLYQICAALCERRPVVLSADEQRLSDLGFLELRPREFVSLVLAGEWKDAAAGDQVLAEGARVSALCVSIAGTMHAPRRRAWR